MKITNIKLNFLIAIAIVVAVALSRLAINKLDGTITNRSRCSEKVLASLNESKKQLPPYKIVFKPWKGRHKVHGIFMLPIGDNSPKMLVVRIPGSGTFCGGAHNVGTTFEGVQAKPGYYLVKANFRTRTATWLIARGFANHLKDSRNWRLIDY